MSTLMWLGVSGLEFSYIAPVLPALPYTSPHKGSWYLWTAMIVLAFQTDSSLGHRMAARSKCHPYLWKMGKKKSGYL